MELSELVKAGEQISSENDFDKMCEGVSYSKAELRVEVYKSRFVIVSEDDTPEPTKDQLCAMKQRLGLNYVRADVLGGEATAIAYEIKASLNSIAGIISTIPPGWKSGEEVYEVRGKGLKLIHDVGLFHIEAITILGTTLNMNTNVVSALAPWPIRCPS